MRSVKPKLYLRKGINGGLTLFLYRKGAYLELISVRGASNSFAKQVNIEHFLHGCKT
nr:MAG TPA: hypothetical protein [Caudoviricetes sp.]